jgi:YbbR domain-containing protein
MKGFLEWLLQNWGLKLTSIFLAATLWFLVRGDSGAERVITVPLEIRVPRNMEIINERPSTVDVTMRGTGTNILFGQTLPTCSIDLQEAGEGEHTVPLSPANVRLTRAAGLEVLAVRPARITLVLERTLAKQVPVQLTVRGDPQPGFEIYYRSHAPTTTLVTGPRSHIDRIREVWTEAVSVAGQHESIRSLARLVIRDSFVHAAPDTVEVRIELGVQRKLQTVSKVPVRIDDPEFTVSPKSVTLQVLVPIYYKQPLASADFTVTVSSRSVDPTLSAARVKPTVRFTGRQDPAVQVREVNPAEVAVLRPRSK